MNVLFIVPLNDPFDYIVNLDIDNPLSKLSKNRKIKKLNIVYPSGVLSISSYISKRNPEFQVRILDLNVVINKLAEAEQIDFSLYSLEGFINDALHYLGDFIPDAIGVSTLFCSVYKDLKPLVSELRSKYSSACIFCGGHLASTLYQRIYRDEIDFDAIAFGEGELPVVELLTSLSSGNGIESSLKSKSWVTRDKLLSEDNPIMLNNVISDLDEIPPYDLNILQFPHEYYRSSQFLFMPEKASNQKEIILFSTRGCPFNCVFCASHHVHGKKVRLYSADRVKRDIVYYNERYGIDKFTFYDDHFLYRKERALEILEFIAKNKFTASIINPAFFAIDEDIAKAMKNAGIKSTILSIESGDKNTFKNIIHKPSSLERAEETVAILHEQGIKAATNVIIGLPGETKESIERGIDYLKITAFNWFNCFVAAPLPGSELFNICSEKDYFVDNTDILNMQFKNCIIKTKEFNPEYIDKKAYEMNLLLNYVNNYDYRIHNFKDALMLFEKVIQTVIESHAFAHYFAAKCCKKLGDPEKYSYHETRYKTIIEESLFWRKYADVFKLDRVA